jgi:hypothetical protein
MCRNQQDQQSECDSSQACAPRGYAPSFRLLNKIAVLLLLFGIAGLATLAKDGQYYPTANPARQVSLSTKMNDSHVPVAVNRVPSDTVARMTPPKPRPVIRTRREPEPLPVQSVGITVTLQHRSPPAVLA